MVHGKGSLQDNVRVGYAVWNAVKAIVSKKCLWYYVKLGKRKEVILHIVNWKYEKQEGNLVEC